MNESTSQDFKKVNSKELSKIVNEVDEIISDIKTFNITETNDLINAATLYIGKKLNMKPAGQGRKKKKCDLGG